eukprot:5155878-Prymnesium_polylepis.2
MAMSQLRGGMPRAELKSAFKVRLPYEGGQLPFRMLRARGAQERVQDWAAWRSLARVPEGHFEPSLLPFSSSHHIRHVAPSRPLVLAAAARHVHVGRAVCRPE